MTSLPLEGPPPQCVADNPWWCYHHTVMQEPPSETTSIERAFTMVCKRIWQSIQCHVSDASIKGNVEWNHGCEIWEECVKGLRARRWPWYCDQLSTFYFHQFVGYIPQVILIRTHRLHSFGPYRRSLPIIPLVYPTRLVSSHSIIPLPVSVPSFVLSIIAHVSDTVSLIPLHSLSLVV